MKRNETFRCDSETESGPCLHLPPLRCALSMRILIAEAFRGPARAERARRFEEAVRGAVATLQNKEPEAPTFIRVGLSQFDEYVYTGVAGTPYTNSSCCHRLLKCDMVFIGEGPAAPVPCPPPTQPNRTHPNPTRNPHQTARVACSRGRATRGRW